MSALLTSRKLAIVDALCEGPKSMRDLLVAAGYDPGDRNGHGYVSQTLGRLAKRGYRVRNTVPPGSHKGAFYILASWPGVDGARKPVCRICRITELNAWNVDDVCWPCQRSMVDVELRTQSPHRVQPVAPGLENDRHHDLK